MSPTLRARVSALAALASLVALAPTARADASEASPSGTVDPPSPAPSHGGVLLGASVAAAFPLFLPRPSAGSGPAVGLSVGGRFADSFYFGLALQHAFLSAGDIGCKTCTATPNYLATDAVDLRFAYLSNPYGLAGFFVEVGAGARFTTLNYSIYGSPGNASPTVSADIATLGLGAHVTIASVRLVPEAMLTVDLPQDGAPVAVASLGVTAYLDFGMMPPPRVSPATTPAAPKGAGDELTAAPSPP
jgi:hypothetical protein